MTTKSVAFYRPDFPEHVRQNITRDIDGILAGGKLMQGRFAEQFERAFCELTGCAHAISVASATTGLQISLKHYDVDGGDVLVPAASFITDVSAVMMCGARPVLVDIDPDTLAIDLYDIKRKQTPATKGVIWVHLTGVITPDYQALKTYCNQQGWFLIEDASHAHGSAIDGKTAGSLGDVGIFSFYPTKIITSGTGGMMTTDNDALARYARELRMFGKDAQGEIVHLGNDWFLDEIRACVGYHHMTDFPRQVSARRAIAKHYETRLSNQPGLSLLDSGRLGEPAWYQYAAFTDDRIEHSKLMDTLKAEYGIETKRIYKPVHREKVFQHLGNGTLKNSERQLDRSLCLPFYSGLNDDEIDYICDCLIAELRRV